MFSKLFGAKTIHDLPVKVDMHSHLIPGIDDGAATLEESLYMIDRMGSMGFEKIITTPHILGDFYRNTPEIINSGLDKVREGLVKRGLSISIEAAAEYYMDEWLFEKLEKNEPLLTLGKNYVLVETSYVNKPNNLNEFIFMLRSNGYEPVIAHPERYTYMYDDFSKFKEFKDRGVLFQLNTVSLSGYYSPMAKKIAEKLLKEKMIDFIGTDCHRNRHLDAMDRTRKLKSFKRLQDCNLLNDELL